MKKTSYFLICILLCLLLPSCGNKSKNNSDNKSSVEIILYYLNPEGTKLLEYKDTSDKIPNDTEGAVRYVIKQLSKSPDLSEYKSVITKDIEFQKITFQDGCASVDFGLQYSKQSPLTEILCRAAIVKSLTQLDRVHNVEITVGGQPLVNQDGDIVGLMNDKSFLDEDSVWKQAGGYGEITLYYANEKGDKLVPYTMSLEIGNHVPMEQRIIEYLIEGPKEKGYKKTVPEGTKVIKTFVKSGICYVDLNEKFLDGVPNIKDEIVIYSIVNSLSELPTISKVQFTIEGQKIEKYHEGIAFDGTFTRNLEVQ